MSGKGPIADLVDLTGRLTAAMSSEVELLRAMRTSEIAALQDDKATLAAAYASALETLRKNPAAVNGAGLGKALKEVTAGLKATLEDNLRAVKAAQMANERLIRALSAAFAEASLPAALYTSAGTTAALHAHPLALAVDDRI